MGGRGSKGRFRKIREESCLPLLSWAEILVPKFPLFNSGLSFGKNRNWLWLALALAITPSAGLSGHASAEIDNFADEMWKFLANFLFHREGEKKDGKGFICG